MILLTMGRDDPQGYSSCALAFEGVAHYITPGLDHWLRRKNVLQIIQLASALVVSFALVIPANAATTSARKSARAECVRLADAQKFGERQIQRRNFIQDCLIERGYNQ